MQIVPIIVGIWLGFAFGAYKSYYNNPSQDAIDQKFVMMAKEECIAKAASRFVDRLEVQHLHAIYEEVCKYEGQKRD